MKSKGLSCLLAALIMLTFIPQTAIPGTTVSYDVYLLSDSFTDPQDGLRVASEEETYEFGGFHKISLSTPVPPSGGTEVLDRDNTDSTGRQVRLQHAVRNRRVSCNVPGTEFMAEGNQKPYLSGSTLKARV